MKWIYLPLQVWLGNYKNYQIIFNVKSKRHEIFERF